MKNQLIKLGLFLGGTAIVILILSALLQSCTPVRVIETITTDSTGKSIKVKTKYYQQTDGYSVEPSVNVITTPIFYNRLPIFVPTYRPTVVIRGYSRGSYRGGFRSRH